MNRVEVEESVKVLLVVDESGDARLDVVSTNMSVSSCRSPLF